MVPTMLPRPVSTSATEMVGVDVPGEHRHAMVPGARRNDPVCSLIVRQLQQRIQRTTELETTGNLKAVILEPDVSTRKRGQGIGCFTRGDAGMTCNTRGGGANIINGERICHVSLERRIFAIMLEETSAGPSRSDGLAPTFTSRAREPVWTSRHLQSRCRDVLDHVTPLLFGSTCGRESLSLCSHKK